MGKGIRELLIANQKKEEEGLLLCNEKSSLFGLKLSKQEITELVQCKAETLKKYQRVEFGKSILEELVFTFEDSVYIQQEEYLAILEKLQEIFYEFKNETEDLLTDTEILAFMREQFETVAHGDIDYLEGTCMENFARAVRTGAYHI